MKGVAWISGIIAISASLGMFVDWRTPGIERESRDWLMRARGTLPAPDDIAIVAIDDASIERLGRFPWARTLMARAIDAVSAAQPKAIALDVLYTDPTADDAALAESIAHAGDVVAAAQLSDNGAWLLPVPGVAHAAAAVGHVNVATESGGIARQLFLRLSDDSGHSLRAMAVEAARIGDSIPEKAVVDGPRALLLGSREIPFQVPPPAVVIGGPHVTLRPEQIAIDYIGPAGSFGPRTYSFADVMEGRVAAASFRNKYVLIGATAESLGDRIASPFVHDADLRGNQHGALMPGVEVLANALNTILRSRFYSETPDWAAFLIAALIAGLTLFLLGAAQGGHEVLKQVAVLAATAGGIVLASYLVFTRALIFPPMTPALVSFASAGVLGLLRRSIDASARLDSTIEEIGKAGDLLIPESAAAGAAESIARLTGAAGVELLALAGDGKFRRVAIYGEQTGQRLTIELPTGKLHIDHAAGRAPDEETERICAAIAASACQTARSVDRGRLPWPHGLEWKARTLERLGGRIHSRARFVDLALRSVEDGLLIAAPDGRITFANPRAGCILGSTDRALIGRDLFQRLAEAEGGPSAYPDALTRLLVDRVTIEREMAVMGPRTMRYMLRIAAVVAGRGAGKGPENGRDAALGIVASLSDVTRQHELQQTKNDVVALVSHEMRTPLTAIQGMSELLAQYDLDAGQRRSMSLVINEEVKRLSRMIGNYLDIARLESGATVLHRSAVRMESLLERTLLLLDPVAAKRGIRLLRRFDADLPALLADPDLISRAISNLVANAIKYSPTGTEVTIRASSDTDRVTITVSDQGYGIAPEDLPRVFDKFFRVPRIEDADGLMSESGTGLGLALVREIAELHEGSVTATSVVGSGDSHTPRGSTFTVSLPRTKA